MASLGNIFVKLGLDTKPFETKMRRAQSTSSKSAQKIGNGLARLRNAFLALTAAAGVGLGLGSAIRDASAYEVALTGVVKTTGLAGDELKDLETRLGGITRRFAASRISLLGLSEAAGQMGVTGSANLAKFSETMARLAVASDVAGEEGGKAIVRLLTITGEGVGVIDRFASTLVDLGNNATASESEILHMATRVGQSLASFKVASSEVLGLSAAMQSVGLPAELAGTAIGRAFRVINNAVQTGGEKAEEMAKRLGLSLGEMQEQFKTRPMEVFVRFLRMLKGEGDNATIAMAELGLAGDRNAAVFPLLAKKVELVEEALERSSGEWRKNNALMAESEQFNKTLNSQFVIFQNTLKSVSTTIGQTLLPSITSILTELNRVMDSGEDRTDLFILFIKAKALEFANWFEAWGKGTFLYVGQQMGLALINGLGSMLEKSAGFMSLGLWKPNLDVKGESLADIIDGIKALQEQERLRTGSLNPYQDELNAALAARARIPQFETASPDWARDFREGSEALAKWDNNGLPANDAAGAIYNAAQGVEALGDAMDDVSDGLPQGRGYIDTTLFGGGGSGDVETVVAKVKKTETAIEGFTLSLTELQLHGRRVFDGFFDLLAEFAETGKFQFKAFARAAIIELAKIQLKALATRAILNLANAGGTTGSIFTGLANAFLGGTTARALGGPVIGGQPYLVGEKGPELMIPRSSGTVIPNDELRSGSGNAGQAIVIHQENVYQGNASPRDMLVWAQQTRDATIQAVSQMIQNGGQPASQFAQ